MSGKNTIRLPMKDWLRVVDWMRSHKGEFEKERPSKLEVSARAAAELNLVLTKFHINSICKSTGIEWIAKSDTPRKSGYGAAMRLMKARIKLLTEALLCIASETGVTLSKDMFAELNSPIGDKE